MYLWLAPIAAVVIAVIAALTRKPRPPVQKPAQPVLSPPGASQGPQTATQTTPPLTPKPAPAKQPAPTVAPKPAPVTVKPAPKPTPAIISTKPRTMYDSVTAKDIPAHAEMVAGYVSGYRWSAEDWARFPRAVKVRIATQAHVDDGVVLDVERGDATPEQAPTWVKMRRSHGIDPTVYCTESAWPLVREAFHKAGVKEPHYWIAAWNNKAQLIPGAVAHQYADPPKSGGHYDLSIVAPYWPGVDIH